MSSGSSFASRKGFYTFDEKTGNRERIAYCDTSPCYLQKIRLPEGFVWVPVCRSGKDQRFTIHFGRAFQTHQIQHGGGNVGQTTV